MATKKTGTTDSGTVAFQVRLDAETHAKLKEASQAADISLNQLVTGLLRGCADNLIQGEAVRKDGVVSSQEMPKCLFLGKTGNYSPAKYEELKDSMHEDDVLKYFGTRELPPPRNGDVWFCLDYSGRGYVKRTI